MNKAMQPANLILSRSGLFYASKKAMKQQPVWCGHTKTGKSLFK